MGPIWRQISAAILLVLSGCELMIVQWVHLTFEGSALSPAAALAAFLGLLAANLFLFRTVRRFARRGPRAFAMSRAFLLVSIGALFSGPLLGAAWALLGLGSLLDADAATARAFVGGGGLALALGFGSVLWGSTVGQRRVRVDRVPVTIRDLPGVHAGVRIAHVTDLHIGPQLRAPRLAGYVERINQLDADLIVITGDLFDYDPAYLEEGCDALAGLQARHGVYAVLGNHDVYTGADLVAEGLARKTSIRVLRDDWARVEVRGAPLYLLGIDDPGHAWEGRELESDALPGLVSEVPRDGAHVLLMHRPSYFAQVVRLGIPLALAGHTHGGQVTLPAPAHHANISRLITRWTRGSFTEGDSTLYVSRGLGMGGPPIRLNCPREIALLELRAAG